MKALQRAFLFLLSTHASLPTVVTAKDLMVGDEVCITGYVMDTFCIERGTLLDNASVTTMKNPELHSYHCLLDVAVCYQSGFNVLGELDPSAGLYCLGLRVDDTEAVLAAGRAHGTTTTSDPNFFPCTTCSGPDTNPIAGYRATVIGTVKELGDGLGRVTGAPGASTVSSQPLLTNIQVLDASVTCDADKMVTVSADEGECRIRAAGDDGMADSSSSETSSTTTTTVMSTAVAVPTEPQVGDEICVTGYIMDTFCINRGTLLDAPDVVTLLNPELHSYHCLLDVAVCVESGYNVLGDKDPITGMYCLGYHLEDTDAVVASGRAAGSVADGCTTCTGDGMGKMGYRATVKGTIKELGDGTQSVTGQPVLTDIQILDASVECATPAPKTVCMAPPPAETTTPAVAPSDGANAPPAGKDCSSDFCETKLTDGYLLRYKLNEPEETVTMELVYDGTAWVGIAFSKDEKMGGSEAVIASPGSGDPPQKYRLGQGFLNGLMSPDEQTLTDASVEVVNGQTVMKFTKPLVEPNQIEVQLGNNFMLWAHGGDSTTIGYHGTNRSPFSLNLSSGESAALRVANKGAWLAHGICAFIAWGVLAPTAVNSSIYRSLFKGALWFKLHRFFNASAYALTITAFAIAVAYISKEGNPHWNTSHAKMGLSMFIIASVQVLWGAARPHLPAPDSGEEKTAIRKVWEFKHRLTGTVLLACGFWQMSAGIKLFAGKYSGVGSVQEQGVTIAYWIWIGFEVVLLLIGGVYFKVFRKPAEEVGNAAGNEGDSLVQAEP